jgi:hypothetical protein
VTQFREGKKQMATDKQIAANHTNAQRSTGPRTPEGKAAIRLNALQHGLLARDIFVDTGDGREDEADYADLVEELRQDLQPQGRLELMLVEKIAAAYWRLRRAAREEASTLRRRFDRLDAGELDRQEKYEKEVRKDLRELNRREDLLMAGFESDELPRSELLEARKQKVVRQLRKNPVGLAHFIRTLDQAEVEVQTTDRLEDDTVLRIEREFATDEDGLLERIHAAGPRRNPGGSLRFSAKVKDVVLDLLQAEQTTLQALLEAVEGRGQAALSAERQAVGLPSEEEVQHIHRYESMYERQFYQAINQLERLQRRRIGEPTLPPLTVEVTGSA